MNELLDRAAEIGDEIDIIFEGGESRYSDRGCVYMLGRYLDDDSDEQELYAEVLYPDPEEDRYDELEAENKDLKYDDDWGYDELKAEIIDQAREAGINENRLIFPGKNWD